VKADLIDIKGKKIDQIEIPESVFGVKPNPVLVAQAVRVYLANQRGGNASTKTRGEVQGSSKKIYKQKGTGRARQGTIRAPHRVGGGIAFGPRPHDFTLSMNQKMRKKALFCALSDKLKDKKIYFVDGLSKLKGKTKGVVEFLSALKLPKKKTIFVIPEKQEMLERAVRNLDLVSYDRVNLLNAYQVLNNDYLVFLKESVEKIK
jgi:large subunit ribosomal protein L4